MPITFVTTGVRGTATTRSGEMRPAPIGKVKDSVTLTAQRSSGGETVSLAEAVPGDDAVVLHIAGGPTLWLHPETAKELLEAQEGAAPTRGGGVIPDGAVRIPSTLRWKTDGPAAVRGSTRGLVGDVIVRAVEIVTGLAEEKLAKLAAHEIGKHFDGRVEAGVYELRADRLTPLKGQEPTTVARSGDPSLVFIHGTLSDCCGSFGKLWSQHPSLVGALFKKYGGRVYALDHPTLTESPIGNAITLVESLPKGARLHLLTHSRGGLVAEVLARVAAHTVGHDRALSPFDGAGNAKERVKLQHLFDLVADRQIEVDRIVRVACPARGTLLASKRLDAYISVFAWVLEKAGLPVVPELIGFLGEVARQKADPEDFPGLAAQIPDSPLIEWLHQAGPAVEGDLRVVAGDIQGDSVVSWVKTLLSDAFYWTDNDLVVQTRSMYGGMARPNKAMFVLDRGGGVSHFSYFGNADTATAIVSALTDDKPANFRAIGPLSWSGTDASGIRAARVSRSPAAAAALPALFVLPGILGSNLKVGDIRIWLAWRMAGYFSSLEYRPGLNDVQPDGPLGLFYDELGTFLSEDHDVIPFGYDWRIPIEESAAALADRVKEALDARVDSKQPVRFIAHSMGGLVVRAMQWVRPEIFKRLLAAEGTRIVMLGTPNDGSWAPMQVLSGDDTFGNVLTSVGAPFTEDKARGLVAAFPGLLQLQADLLGEMGQAATWQKLAAADLAALRRRSLWHNLGLQLRAAEWGVPTQDVLDQARGFRQRLNQQRDNDLASFADRTLLVVGHSPFTPRGYALEDEGVVYRDVAEEGDGTVTLQSALLPGVATWTLDCEHGSMPRRRTAFEAYRELLQTGTTKRLARLSTQSRGRAAVASEAAVSRSRPSRSLASATPPERETDILMQPGEATSASQALPPRVAQRLTVTVINGDLTYVAEPLLIGHYRSMRLTGAEAVMDRAIGGMMAGALQRGVYPVEVGSHQIFHNTQPNRQNPFQLPRPVAVIVAGLGPEGELRGTGLVTTVRQAVIAWSQRLLEQPTVPPVFTLATTLMGSGGVGIDAGQAALLIAQGVQEANERLASGGSGSRWPQVDKLHIIELYLDRAADAWRALQALAQDGTGLVSVYERIQEGVGGIRRPPDGSYRGADYDFISAIAQQTADEGETIAYSVDTKRARTEVRSQAAQLPLIRSLIHNASNAYAEDDRIGRTLFSLLVPVDLEPFLASSTATVLEVEPGTAGIPWELLDNQPPGGDDRPWAIRTKLLRKLRMAGTSPRVSDASAADGVLVIGDPDCERKKYPRLLAARQEATDVAACFNVERQDDERIDANQRATSLIGSLDLSGADPDAGSVIKHVMGGDWRVIHIAAHGEPPITVEGRLQPRGVVLSNDAFLGPHEIAALRVVPELVFINCCYLARGDESSLLTEMNYNRATFAAGVAEALIRGGVRCVVAAGWAVDDTAAHTFATTFYGKLLDGATFSDSVAAAREETKKCRGTTWAAYQCYGDPDWRYRRSTADAQRPTLPDPSRELAGIASEPGLLLALETMAVKSEFQGADEAAQADRLRFLEATHAPWCDRGRVAEAFAHVWATLNRFDEAIDWYERAQRAGDGTASLNVLEQLANLRARRAWERLSLVDEPAAEDLDAARKEIEGAMALLQRLLDLSATPERHSLLASAYKRLALVESRGGAEREFAERAALEQARTHIEQVKKKGFYQAMNVIAVQMALAGRTPSDPNPELDAIEAVCVSMRDTSADFWSVVGQTEMAMYKAIVKGELAAARADLEREFTSHHQKVAAQKRWASIYDNATLILSTYRRRLEPISAESAAAAALLALLARLAGVGRSVPRAPSPLASDAAVPAADGTSSEMPLKAGPRKRPARRLPSKTAKPTAVKTTAVKTTKKAAATAKRKTPPESKTKRTPAGSKPNAKAKTMGSSRRPAKT